MWLPSCGRRLNYGSAKCKPVNWASSIRSTTCWLCVCPTCHVLRAFSSFGTNIVVTPRWVGCHVMSALTSLSCSSCLLTIFVHANILFCCYPLASLLTPINGWRTVALSTDMAGVPRRAVRWFLLSALTSFRAPLALIGSWLAATMMYYPCGGAHYCFLLHECRTCCCCCGFILILQCSCDLMYCLRRWT